MLDKSVVHWLSWSFKQRWKGGWSLAAGRSFLEQGIWCLVGQRWASAQSLFFEQRWTWWWAWWAKVGNSCYLTVKRVWPFGLSIFVAKTLYLIFSRSKHIFWLWSWGVTDPKNNNNEGEVHYSGSNDHLRWGEKHPLWKKRRATQVLKAFIMP